MPVTRIEIADDVRAAFAHGPASRPDVLAAAVAAHARPAVMETLERLPDRSYSELRHLWSELADIPLEP